MTITVRIVERTLSDLSKVYDVQLGGVPFPAVTETDAISLADKLSAAIEAHTNETVTRDFT